MPAITEREAAVLEMPWRPDPSVSRYTRGVCCDIQPNTLSSWPGWPATRASLPFADTNPPEDESGMKKVLLVEKHKFRQKSRPGACKSRSWFNTRVKPRLNTCSLCVSEECITAE